MSVLGLLFDAAKPFVAGVVLVLLPPVLAGALPDEYAQSIWNTYESMAVNLLDRGVLTVPSMKLRRVSRDRADAKEEIGSEGYDDQANLMHRWHGRPFGIVDERVATVSDPRMMDVASRLKQRQNQGLASVDHGRTELFAAHVPVPREQHAVDPDGTIKAVGGSAPPQARDHISALVEKAHALYDSADLIDIMIWLMAFGVGAGAAWVASEVATRSSGGGTVVPVSILPVIL